MKQELQAPVKMCVPPHHLLRDLVCNSQCNKIFYMNIHIYKYLQYFLLNSSGGRFWILFYYTSDNVCCEENVFRII